MSYLGDLNARGVTREQMARLLGISPHTISSWTRKDHRTKMVSATSRLIEVLTILRDQAPELHTALVNQAKSEIKPTAPKPSKPRPHRKRYKLGKDSPDVGYEYMRYLDR